MIIQYILVLCPIPFFIAALLFPILTSWLITNKCGAMRELDAFQKWRIMSKLANFNNSARLLSEAIFILSLYICMLCTILVPKDTVYTVFIILCFYIERTFHVKAYPGIFENPE